MDYTNYTQNKCQFIVTAEQMKSAEANAAARGISHMRLAENAAMSCFNRIYEFMGDVVGKTFTILCGTGMNGGDGILIASLLKQSGAEVLCVFVDDIPKSGTASEIYVKHYPTLTMTSYAGNEDTVKYTLQNTHVIIDCVYGLGFRCGVLKEDTADLFDFINNDPGCYNSVKYSVDLPSGVNATSGDRAYHSFIPDITLILGGFKKGLLSHSCRDYCGEYVLVDIGLTEQDYSEFEAVFTDSSILSYCRERFLTSHKGDYGRLLNIAGSERYIGAALLSTKAAVKAGAGLVTLAAPDFVVSSVAHAVPEAVFTRNDIESVEKELENVSAISVGCGIGATEESRLMTEYVIRNAPCPIILDADGINSISDNINVLQENKYELSYREEEKEDVSDNSENAENGDNVENSESELSVTPKVILTPHPAEFARLTGLTVEEIQSNRIDYAKIFAKESSAIVVLKGVNTVIASPCGKVYVNSTGNAGLAKAGTGDVLTGIIASLTAQGIGLFEASVLGVYLHGLAADELAKTSSLSSITASEIINYI